MHKTYFSYILSFFILFNTLEDRLVQKLIPPQVTKNSILRKWFNPVWVQYHGNQKKHVQKCLFLCIRMFMSELLIFTQNRQMLFFCFVVKVGRFQRLGPGLGKTWRKMQNLCQESLDLLNIILRFRYTTHNSLYSRHYQY